VETKDALEQLARLVEQARAMPMSASCIVNRAEVLALIERASQALPDDLARAEEVLAERDRVIDAGRVEAERLIDRTRAEQRRMMAQTAVAQEAEAEAASIIDTARRQAAELKAEADDYVDAKLANFEVVLTRTLQAVGRGRERLRGLSGADFATSIDDGAESAPFGRDGGG
jgi:hypothetical protein